MKKSVDNTVSAEMLAAYLDGNATEQESQMVLDALAKDAELRELMRISQSVDMDLGLQQRECEIIPMTAMAASCDEGNYCSLECEKYILRKLDISFDEQQLLDDAIHRGWQKEEGTALHNVGRHLEGKGLIVARQYKCTTEDIASALENKEYVIAAVDGGELIGDKRCELKEDILVGEIPDHTVVILSYDKVRQEITIFEPNSPNAEDTYPIIQFVDAWNDSKNYLVTINTRDMKTYNPKPIDLSDVELTEDLNELREAIAENAHDVWAVERQAQGWSYGPQRDDVKKHNPCMVPYSQLPENEKTFDREMAMNTLKLVKKLGYDLVKREETELYRVLKQRLQDSDEEFHCPECEHVVYKNQVFCDKCGAKLDIDWTMFKK